MAKPPTFNKKKSKVLGFLTVYKFYIRIKMKDASVEKYIQCVLSCIQEELADIWKENILKDSKAGELEFLTVEDFLIKLKKEFGGGDNETMKMAEF